ncbi:MAG TPA: PEGA domain-containing protein, partial [Nannocystaceae bacterium]|nr:PEGA domain-containing protein [Nannocystaceae bacterium]
IAATLTIVWLLPRTPEPPIVIAAPEAPHAIPLAVATPVATPPAAPQLGHLVVTVEPRDAIVRVDGRSIAGPSPFVATNLAVGSHAIAVERDGFETWSRTIDVPSGELDLPIVLVAMPPTIVEPTKPSATVRMRGREAKTPVGLKDPFQRSDDDSSDPLASGEGSPDLMNPFVPGAEQTATLRIGTNPGAGPAQVFVDGKLLGTTPIGAHKVAAGKHRVKWKWPDGREVTQVITVKPDEVQIVKNG